MVKTADGWSELHGAQLLQAMLASFETLYEGAQMSRPVAFVVGGAAVDDVKACAVDAAVAAVEATLLSDEGLVPAARSVAASWPS